MDTLKNKKVHFETYGCTFNFADTEKLKEIATANGCEIVTAEEADAVCINSCTVVAQTQRAMLRAVNDYQGKEVYITGCMPVVQADELRDARPDIHIILPEDIYLHTERVGAITDEGVGVVQIGTGCLGGCAYCITRLARGRLRSFSEKSIINETKRLVSEGASEIQLTGQDVSAYGRDKGTDLSRLLHLMNEIEGDFAVRVGMMNPATVLPILKRLVPAFSLEKVFSFVHLPVQSGSDHVLSTMNRGYKGSDFVKIVDTFRTEIPDVRISTDFIVGYPTETDKEFEETLDILNITKPTKVNITRFSVREGTAAAEYKDFPDWVKKERSREMTIAANKIYDENNEKMIGRVIPVAVTEEKKAGSVIARDKSYNNIVIKESLPIGMKLDVKIVSHNRHYLIGEKTG
ncbi:tRNA (N(6)-L-threonylcarbamoyladenosine(37)-C(2))-methylthiotransferase [Methanoplanus sp. FWC-SCC4]|uniref:tRNA-t(6)A37 methylthiotransferase n=1 Tax=Methanochimaera problematica TaxID=2609417 RepID=A0AA97I4S1_9EURY|nr:tRNA (N(6)-L-threonylcarbamoyladenosine(37)-C(2))-methylthiotransferase [Methanoplanus sp. FWC-SCC4]WOF17231.1 tRNA (N(6)-L-threonylcarbamoyladenosine(37)-C(2))-methylthiotransferase [Methanoplanus sp. FWC-SCC4]